MQSWQLLETLHPSIIAHCRLAAVSSLYHPSAFLKLCVLRIQLDIACAAMGMLLLPNESNAWPALSLEELKFLGVRLLRNESCCTLCMNAMLKSLHSL